MQRMKSNKRKPRMTQTLLTFPKLGAHSSRTFRPIEVDNMKIWLWNANGIAQKIDQLDSAIESDPRQPGVIIVTETHLLKGSRLPPLPGYQSFAKATGRKSGVGVYVSDTMDFKAEQSLDEDRIITIKTENFAVIGAYAPVDCANADEREDFFEHLTATIMQLKSDKIDCIVLGGDLNAQLAGHGHAEDNGNGTLTRRLCSTTGLFVTPQTEATWSRPM